MRYSTYEIPAIVTGYNGNKVTTNLHKILKIKTHGSESQGQEEAVCARLQAYATTTVSNLHVAEL